MLSNADRYWIQFLDSLPESELPSAYSDVFHFGSSRESARQITPLVLQRIKTATGSLLWAYEAEGRPVPKAGDYSIVTNGKDDPVCIIQTWQVNIIPYDEVDEQFAHDGGEEDRSLESWRRIYWDYLVVECARIGREPSPQTPLVCERFRLVYGERREDNQDGEQ
jgi:uncharacterized protein YhfF